MKNMLCQHFSCEWYTNKTPCSHSIPHEHNRDCDNSCSFECIKDIKNCIEMFNNMELNKIFDELERI